MNSHTMAPGWLSLRDLTEGARMRLFCLPHAGSGSAAFYRWRRLLPAGIDLCPIFLPGRETRTSETPFLAVDALVEAIAEAIAPHLDRPYAFFGHSMGALLAFELAHRLRETGLRPPERLFLSGRIAPHLAPSHRQFHGLPDGEFLAELDKKYGGLPKTLVDDPELRTYFLPILRADLTVVETYTHRVRTPLDSPMHLFAGAQDQSVSPAHLAAWQQHTTEAFSAKIFPGDHFYHLGSSGADLLAEIARILAL